MYNFFLGHLTKFLREKGGAWAMDMVTLTSELKSEFFSNGNVFFSALGECI